MHPFRCCYHSRLRKHNTTIRLHFEIKLFVMVNEVKRPFFSLTTHSKNNTHLNVYRWFGRLTEARPWLPDFVRLRAMHINSDLIVWEGTCKQLNITFAAVFSVYFPLWCFLTHLVRLFSSLRHPKIWFYWWIFIQIIKFKIIGCAFVALLVLFSGYLTDMANG